MTLALDNPSLVTPTKPSQLSTESSTQRLVFYGDWEQFCAVRQGFEQSKRARLAYYEGTIEIIMPGRAHELFTYVIGFLIGIYLCDRDQQFIPTGSMTQEVKGTAAIEADNSYEIGEYRLSVEVKVTSGSLKKLVAYRSLGVNEVWFWEDGVLRLYHLIDGEYTKVDRSQIPQLSDLDIAVFSKCILKGETDLIAAKKELQSAYPV